MSSGPAVGEARSSPGPGHGRHQHLVVAAEVVDLGRHLDRVVEQLLEEAVGTLGELDVLVPGGTQTGQGTPDGGDPGVAVGGDVGGRQLEAGRGVSQLAPLGADAGVGGGSTEFRTGHRGLLVGRRSLECRIEVQAPLPGPPFGTRAGAPVKGSHLNF